jgi:hypothetical protein
MSTEDYGAYDDSESYVNEAPEEDVDPATAITNLVAQTVDAQLAQRDAAEQMLADEPDLDPEALGRAVEERAQALGHPELSRDLRFWADTREFIGATRQEAAQPQTAEQLFDEQVIGNQHPGARVLDFGPSD